MKKRQTKLSFFSIIMLGWLFVCMQAFVPVDGLTQDDTDEGSFSGEPLSPGPHSFYPVTPCRIADSRTSFAPWVQGGYIGPFFVGQTICYSNYGPGVTIRPQGGNFNGCASPIGEPGAFHVVVSSVPVAGQGHVRLYPANVGRPNAAVLGWSLSKGVISNAVSADSHESSAADEFCIYIGGVAGSRTHIIMDVMGYFD